MAEARLKTLNELRRAEPVTQGSPDEGQRPLEEQNTQEPRDPESSQRRGGPPEEDTAAVLLVAATLLVVTIVLGLLGVNIPA
jgi:hypothetical protein